MNIHALANHCVSSRSLEVLFDPQVQQAFNNNSYGLSFGNFFHLMDAHLRINYTDKDVLEIGGASPPTFVLDVLKVKSWTSVQKSYLDPEYQRGNQSVSQTSPNYHVYEHAFGLQYFVNSNVFNSNSFTAAFSLACFEHVDDLAGLLDACNSCLHQGSLLYSYFTPIWSGPNSHLAPPHDSLNYPYYHLCFDYSSMYLYLLQHGLSHKDAAHQSFLHYKSDNLNRLTCIDYSRIFENCQMKLLELFPINSHHISNIDPRIKSRIIERYPSLSDLCDGFRVLLKSS